MAFIRWVIAHDATDSNRRRFLPIDDAGLCGRLDG